MTNKQTIGDIQALATDLVEMADEAYSRILDMTADDDKQRRDLDRACAIARASKDMAENLMKHIDVHVWTRSAEDAGKRSVSAALVDVIGQHSHALSTRKLTAPGDEDITTDCDEYRRFEDAEKAFVVFPCRTQADIQAKLKYATDCRELADAIPADRNEAGIRYQQLFLKSRMLPPVDTIEASRHVSAGAEK